MATDVEKLVVRLEANQRQFEKQLAAVNRSTDRRARSIETRFEKMNSKVSGIFKNFGKGLLAGVAAGGITGIVSQIANVANGIARIGDEAKRAGLSLESFQELKYVAEQNRIGVDALTDGLKELNLRADEFISTGKGSAAEAFQRLGYGAAELTKKLEDPSELMLEIIGRLGQMEKAAQIRIADELFGGTGGERFVQLIERGEDGIRATIDEAHRLGAVMDRDVIEKAAELDRRFNAITTTVSTGLKTAIVEAASALQDFIDSFRSFADDYQRRLNAAKAGAAIGAMAGETLPPGRPPTRTTPKTDRLPRAEWTPPTPPPGGFGSSSGSSRDRGAAAAEREAEAVRRLIDELEHEMALIGATDLEREIANGLRDAGAAATDQQRAKIVALISALHAEAQATEAAADAAEEMRDVGRDVLGGLIQDIRSGVTAAEALESALSRVADRLLDVALDSLFAGGGGIGGLFASIFHDGGVAGQGGRSRRVHPATFLGAQRYHKGGIAGLRSDEVPAILQKGETILPRGMKSGGGSTVVSMPISIDARNADAAGLARVREQLSQLERSLPRRIDERVNTRQIRQTRP